MTTDNNIVERILDDFASLFSMIGSASKICSFSVRLCGYTGNGRNGDYVACEEDIMKLCVTRTTSLKEWERRCVTKINTPASLSIRLCIKDKDGDWTARDLEYENKEDIMYAFNFLTQNTVVPHLPVHI